MSAVKAEQRRERYKEATMTPVRAGESYEQWRERQIDRVIALADEEIEAARAPRDPKKE